MSLEAQFERMGARVKLAQPHRWRRDGIDIQKDKKGEFFELRFPEGVDVQVVDCQPKDRHLLLMVRTPEGKDKFLCGHDERDWFVAAVPEKQGVSNVRTAKEALKPTIVRDEQAKKGVRSRDFGSRHTEAYIRQGEWFFLPRPNLKVANWLIIKDEPIVRGRVGKPHYCEFMYRTGGTRVYVNNAHPNGLTESEYRALPESRRVAGNFRVGFADAEVFVKGRVRHPDHKTIILPFWHKVVMNTETESRAMRNVRFID